MLLLIALALAVAALVFVASHSVLWAVVAFVVLALVVTVAGGGRWGRRY